MRLLEFNERGRERESARGMRRLPLACEMPTIKGFRGLFVCESAHKGTSIFRTIPRLVRSYVDSLISENVNIWSKSLNCSVLAVKMAPVQGTLPVRINEE